MRLPKRPTNPQRGRELHSLIVSRLLDLKQDQEHGDTSIADLLSKADDETQLRRFVAGSVRDRAFGKFNSAQEDELADAKRPDIRFFGNGFDGPVPCELKIADRWSEPNFMSFIEPAFESLPPRRTLTIWHISLNSKWKKVGLGFAQRLAPHEFWNFCTALQVHIDNLTAARPDKEAVMIVGIN